MRHLPMGRSGRELEMAAGAGGSARMLILEISLLGQWIIPVFAV